MDEFDALGPAEQHVVAELRGAIETARTEAKKLLEALEEIDTDQIEGSMLDSKRKETVIAMVEPMRKLAQYLSQSGLVPLLVKVMLEPKASASA